MITHSWQWAVLLLLLILIFGVLCLYLDRTVGGQEVKWEREREMGMGSGKVREPALELGTREAQQCYMSTHWGHRH